MISTSTCSEHHTPEYWDEIEEAAFKAERVALERAADEKSCAVPFRALKVPSAKKSKKAVGRPPKEITTRLRAIEQWFRLARSEIGLGALVGKPALKIKPRRKTLLPSWERLEEEAKVLVSVLALFNRGSAATFNLNLGHRLLEQLTTGDPLSRDKLRERIHAELRRVLGYPACFVMVMEETHKGRLHVHGAVEWKPPSKLRVGVVSTPVGVFRYSKCVDRMSKPIAPARADDPNHTLFPGFQALFGTEWPSEPDVWLEIDPDELSKVIRISDRHQAIHKAVSLYSDAIAAHLRDSSESPVDLWMAVVPEDVHKYCRPQSVVEKSERESSGVLMNKAAATRLLRQPGLFESDNKSAEIYLYDLDFHNQLKSRLLEHRAAVQVVRETTLTPEEFVMDNGKPLRGLQDPATLAWNLATTCYFKAGGKPWQLAASRPGVCYVGIVFKKDFSSPEPGNACCGAQMFLDSGDGVVFRGAVGPWITSTDNDFHLPKDKAKSLMSMVVDAYRKNHGGQPPKELFVHGKTRFSDDEWAGFRETVPAETNVVCVRIREDSGMKLYRHGTINVLRGLGWVKSQGKAFLWTKGFVPRLQTYAGREVPNPLSIEIVKGEADIQQVMADVLALTKLNYNGCIYGDGLPVTLRFADSVGEILTAAPRKNDLPPLPFRYYI